MFYIFSLEGNANDVDSCQVACSNLLMGNGRKAPQTRDWSRTVTEPSMTSMQ